MNFTEILRRLKSLSDPDAVKGMARFGISPGRVYGVSIPDLRRMAREIGTDHPLAEKLWSSGIRDARILASMIDNPDEVTAEQMERWVQDFDSWDVCDQCCNNLFGRTDFAYQKAVDWSSRDEEYVKRAGFVLMACLAVHDKKAKNEMFLKFLPLITEEAVDDRNFVKKAVNWALRQIGKRNRDLNEKATKTAMEIQQLSSKSAKWIASDALRELKSGSVQTKLEREELR